MKIIGSLLLVLSVQYVSATSSNVHIAQNIADYKAIADTLPAASAADATTVLAKMEKMGEDILKSIDGLVFSIYISNTIQNLSTDIVKQKSMFQSAFRAVIWAAVKATTSTSLKGKIINDVKNSLKELSSAAAVFSNTLTSKISIGTNPLTQLNSESMANVKLLADAIQNLNGIDNATIPDMVINLVQQTLARVTVGIPVKIGAQDDPPIIYKKAVNVFQSISNGFSQALDLLPESFKQLSGNVIKAADVLSSRAIAMFQEVVSAIDANKPLLMGNDYIPAALKTYAALRDMAKSIAAINDAAAGQLTPNILIVLINLLKIFSYEFSATVEIYGMVSDLIDNYNNAVMQILTPIWAEKVQFVNSAASTLKVSRTTDLNTVYDATTALLNNFIKRRNADIEKYKTQFK